ncbi:MAG: ATP-dependent DNA helicase RecG [Candidatus Limivivens sp.]|nr:ATP-dependent DNA helicase RecG [Candidatus Limivivens sp.]
MNEVQELDSLKGIGEKTKQIFGRAGISDVGDLLHYFPRTYETFEEITAINEIQENQTCAVLGVVERDLNVIRARSLQMTNGSIRDESGAIGVTWYHMPYLKNTVKRGAQFVFRGKAVRKRSRLILEQPAMYSPEEYQALLHVLQPVYPLCEGLTNNMLQKAIRQVIRDPELTRDYLPAGIRERWKLADFAWACEQIHFPEDMEHMLTARHRLVFDEFFLFILSVRALREKRIEADAAFPMEEPPFLTPLIGHLDFELTGAQKRVWEEIRRDLSGSKVCARLIQGDVGSGKTILAFLALLFTAGNGCQGAMMAPTEVLAVQHFEALKKLLEQHELPFVPVLLTGSLTAREKREAYAKIQSHEVDIIIGTHALIQEKVVYDRLALVITDEQHRFGVRQREALGEKGRMPHTLVMSATPIPRTLAVILYGDLDISVVDELPANRLPIKNCVVDTRYRPKAWEFIRKEVENGHQAYVICPMVEESEAVEAENVLEYAAQLKSALPEMICVEPLHGKMKPKDKNAIMERFVKNDIQVLVSTTVVEVGVNVPNATVMMIENAERFGLAQLHQLRGRVGRGKAQSYCIMVYASDSRRTRERLEILNQSNDGFYIAGEDLKLRGPGDLFGIRQSGVMNFRIGDIFQDAKILKEAGEAVDFCEKMGEEALPEFPVFLEKARRYWNLNNEKLNL